MTKRKNSPRKHTVLSISLGGGKVKKEVISHKQLMKELTHGDPFFGKGEKR